MRRNPLLRDQKKQQRYYSGKKKRHCLKNQVVINLSSKQILAIGGCKGKQQDKKLFDTQKLPLSKNVTWLADLAYLGIECQHANTQL